MLEDKVLSTEAIKVGLHINIEKTKYLAIPKQHSDLIISDNRAIEEVDDFRYLGAVIRSPAVDLETRRGKAWGEFWKMGKIWKSEILPLELKFKIYYTTCIAIFLYGCETWQLTKKMCNRIDSFATSCYRIMLNIKRTDRVRNVNVLNTVSRPPLSTTVKQRQLKWLGHTLRKDSLASKYSLYMSRGRPPCFIQNMWRIYKYK